MSTQLPAPGSPLPNTIIAVPHPQGPGKDYFIKEGDKLVPCTEAGVPYTKIYGDRRYDAND